jgi:hypothetical protein
MKKLSVLVLAMLFIGEIFAQHTPAFGLKGGLNISDLKFKVPSGNVEPEHSTALGVHAGFLAHMHLSKNIGLQPELLYSGQGMELTTGSSTFDVKLNYLNLPVMIQYMFDNGFRVEAGPQFGLLLNAKIQDNTGTTSITKNYKKGDVGLGFGLNYLTYSGFGIGGSYNLGLGNINKTEGATANKIYNRVGQISLFYMFKSNHKAASAK